MWAISQLLVESFVKSFWSPKNHLANQNCFNKGTKLTSFESWIFAYTVRVSLSHMLTFDGEGWIIRSRVLVIINYRAGDRVHESMDDKIVFGA